MHNPTKATISLWSIMAMLALAACAREPKAAHTVDDYMANRELRVETLKACANNPGELGNTPDCVNVKAATKQHDIGSLKDLEPMKWPTPGQADPTSKPP